MNWWTVNLVSGWFRLRTIFPSYIYLKTITLEWNVPQASEPSAYCPGQLLLVWDDSAPISQYMGQLLPVNNVSLHLLWCAVNFVCFLLFLKDIQFYLIIIIYNYLFDETLSNIHNDNNSFNYTNNELFYCSWLCCCPYTNLITVGFIFHPSQVWPCTSLLNVLQRNQRKCSINL